MKKFINALSTEIERAATLTFQELFKNGENYYYCTLVTTGEGHLPLVSAWSWEALEREAKKNETIENYKSIVKWSYSDSPYFNIGEDNFKTVKKLLSERPSIGDLDEHLWNIELRTRLEAMELAMKQMDNNGLFTANQARSEICILAEIMPPDRLNTEIAIRLNNSESIKDWLREASE
jgi:Domain of unknown function (DUF4303)